MKTRPWAKLALPAFLALLALGYLSMTAGLPVPPFGGPVTARAFPAILGVGLLVAALLLLVERLGHAPAPPSAPDQAETQAEAQAEAQTGPRERLVPAAVAIWTLVYVSVLEQTGFILATSVFLAGLMLAFHRHRPAQALAAAIGFSIAIYLLFAHGLGIALPAGLLV